MISKGYIYHVVRSMDVESETPSLESVRVENKFANVFPDNFRVICPDGEIDFGIDLFCWIHNLYPFIIVEWL